MDNRRNNHHSRSRSRSRSRSPPSHHRGDDFRSDNRNNHYRRDTRDNTDKMDRERIERERRERMARMRAEIDAEERGIAPGSGDTAPNNQTGETSNQKSNQNKNNDDEELDDEQRQMMQMMGFGGFGTTKGKSVGDNQTSAAKGAASKNKGRKYRQYMNRKGGFNRPLDKMT
mmetsp:Transcript_901/g.1754  ORF Transcript_901/g.1754 Transcript_901/m.1754 type:complete len:172 (+) Transcript_901:86-601(+)